jgi:hypothetical protein
MWSSPGALASSITRYAAVELAPNGALLPHRLGISTTVARDQAQRGKLLRHRLGTAPMTIAVVNACHGRQAFAM